MPNTICPSYAFGRRARFTRLDGCGRPVAGAGNQVVTKAFTEVVISPNVLTGDEVTVKNAGGELCISDKALDQIKWFTTKITLCSQDPDLIQMMNPTYFKELDDAGNAIGFRVDTSTTYAAGFALELWMDVTGIDLCADENAEGQWGYLLLPFVQGGIIGDITVSNKENLTVFNGRTLVNPKWGVGPYNIQRNTAGDPIPLLTPVGATQPVVMFPTTLAPPDAVCGASIVPPMQMPTPTGLAVSGTPTGTTAAVTWTPVAGASGYRVTAVKTGTTSPVFTAVVSGLTGTLSGLTPLTGYTVTVVAKGDGVNTLDSAGATTTVTTGTQTQLNPVTALAVSGTPTATAFNVAWTAPSPAPSVVPGYKATAVKTGTTTPVINGSVTGTTAAFSGAPIVTGTLYVVSITALGDGMTTSDSLPTTTNVTTA